MDAFRDADLVMDGEPTIDHYQLDLWPTESAPDVIVHQTSDIAAYWHRIARQTPLHQPG